MQTIATVGAQTSAEPKSSNISLSLNRYWKRTNVRLRSWSRHMVDRHDKALLWIMSVAAVLAFYAIVIFENVPVTVTFAMVAVAAMLPWMTKFSYEQPE